MAAGQWEGRQGTPRGAGEACRAGNARILHECLDFV